MPENNPFNRGQIRVAVGLSGGVDSAVAAYLLKRTGFRVTAVFLRCFWTHEGCSSDQDRATAAKVAGFLNVPFEVWDFEKAYREKVIEYFYREYREGRTPNPDVVCNREIKFGLFFNEAVKNRGYDFLATGHYSGTGVVTQSSGTKDRKAQEAATFPFFYQGVSRSDIDGNYLVNNGDYFELLEMKRGNRKEFDTYYNGPVIFGGVDDRKDQSYFLYDISNDAIDHTLYPLFWLTKNEVRSIARKISLPNAERPDSSGICFIGEVNVEKFLKERIKENPGEVINTQGRIIGRHKGIEFYTIGQRHGFELRSKISRRESGLVSSKLSGDGGSLRSNQKDQKSKIDENEYTPPYYVIRKDVKKNLLIVGVGEECRTDQFHVRIGRPLMIPDSRSEVLVRIRHLGEMIPCRIEMPNDTSAEAMPHSGGKCRMVNVILAYPVFAVAPGQSAVFYHEVTSTQVTSTQVTSTQITRHKLYEVIGGGVIEE